MSDDERDPTTWPELTYAFADYYFWFPQHLFRTIEGSKAAKARGLDPVVEFRKRVRSQEPPLNYITNVFLKIIPAQFRRACLSVFGLDPTAEELGHVDISDSEWVKFCYPDIVLESDSARVFIELKVKAKLGLKQVQQYLFLHAHHNRIRGDKKPYLLFLTKRPFIKNWDPPADRSSMAEEGVEKYLRKRLKGSPPLGNLGKYDEVKDCLREYSRLVDAVVFGHATWHQLGDIVDSEAKKRAGTNDELGQVIGNIVGGFLEDLRLRRLWKPGISCGSG